MSPAESGTADVSVRLVSRLHELSNKKSFVEVSGFEPPRLAVFSGTISLFGLILARLNRFPGRTSQSLGRHLFECPRAP